MNNLLADIKELLEENVMKRSTDDELTYYLLDKLMRFPSTCSYFTNMSFDHFLSNPLCCFSFCVCFGEFHLVKVDVKEVEVTTVKELCISCRLVFCLSSSL